MKSRRRTQWDEFMVEFVKLVYPSFSNKELMEYLGCTNSRLEAFCTRHHLKKVPTKRVKNKSKQICIKLDLTNEKFGKLIARYNTDQKEKNNYLWHCECECGNTIRVRASQLRCGQKTHCGCVPPKSGVIHHRRGGYGGIGGSQWSKIKSNARERGIEFNISVEYAWSVFEKQNGKCKLSGLPIKFPENFKEIWSGTASLDRIDSSLPYQIGNIQWLHKEINMMKHVHSEEHFILLCQHVTLHQNSTREQTDA